MKHDLLAVTYFCRCVEDRPQRDPIFGSVWVPIRSKFNWCCACLDCETLLCLLQWVMENASQFLHQCTFGLVKWGLCCICLNCEAVLGLYVYSGNTWLCVIQIKICAEYRDMLPRPRLVCQEPGLRPIGRSPGPTFIKPDQRNPWIKDNYDSICCPQFCTYSYQILCHVGGTSPPTWHKIW